MASRKITTIFDAQTRKLTAGVKTGITEIQGLKKVAKREARAIERTWGPMARNIGRALQTISAAGVAAFGLAGRTAIGFEKNMRNVNSIAKQNETQFRKTAKAVRTMGASLKLNQTPEQLAAALYDINSAGFAGQKGLKVLEIAAKAASGGLTDAKVAGDGLTTALNAYGRSAEDAAKFGDVLFKTVELGKTNFEALSSNMGKVATVAANAGVSFEELNSGFATLTAKGLSTEESAVALRGVILKLLKPTAEGAKLFDQLGIAYGSAALKAEGLGGILTQIQEKTGGNQEAIATLLGDVRAFNGALGLLGEDGGRSFLATTEKMANSAGALNASLEEQRKALGFQLGVLKSSVQSMAIVFGNAIAPAIKFVADGIGSLVEKFSQLSDRTQGMVATATAIGVGLAGVAGTALALAPALASVSTIMGTAAWASFVGTLGTIGSAIAGLAAPVGAAAAVVAGLYLAWKNNFVGIKDVTREWYQETRAALEEVADFFSGAWREITTATRTAWELIGPIVGNAVELAQRRLEIFGAFLKGAASVAWETFSGSVKIAWEQIKGFVSIGVETIKTLVRTGSAIMEGDFSTALGHMGNGAERILGLMKETFRRTLQAILELLRGLGGEFREAGRELAQRMVDGALGPLQEFKFLFKDAAAGARGEFKNLGDQLHSDLSRSYGSVLELTKTFGDQYKEALAAALDPSAALRTGTVKAGSAPARFRLGGSGGGSGSSSGMTEAELVSAIRAGSDVKSNVSFEGATRELLQAMKKFVDNSNGMGLTPTISSVTDGKHSPNSYHYSGMAMDFGYYRPDGGLFPADVEAALAKKALGGTGFQGMLNELLGGSPHIHAALGTGDSGDPRFSLIETGFQEVEEAQRRHHERKEEAERKHMDRMMKIMQDMTKTALSLGGEGTSLENAPKPTLVDIDAEIAAIEERETAEFESRLRIFDLKIQLGIASQEQKALWLEQELERENLNYEQKLRMETLYQQTKQKLEVQTRTQTQKSHSILTQSFSTFIQSMLTGQQTAGNAIKQFWNAVLSTIIRKLVEAIVKATILQKILSSIGGFFGGLFGLGGSVISAGGSAVQGLGGGMEGMLKIPFMHSGGMVGQDGFSRSLQGPGGLRSDEVIRVLQVGETVIPRGGGTFAAGGAGGAREFTINVNGATFANDMDVEHVAHEIGYRINQRFGNA